MTAVLLFAKAPRPGAVKTRLARDLGEAAAASVYRALGVRVAEAVSVAFPLTVWYEPPGAEAEMRAWLGDRHRYVPQPEGDLGERLRLGFATHFQGGGGPAIAIGADAPDVDAAVVAAAFARLERADVVLGPAVDGGYYLVGLARPTPALFAGVPWGTGGVLHETLAICRREGLRVARLPPLRDVDTIDDLRAAGLDRP